MWSCNSGNSPVIRNFWRYFSTTNVTRDTAIPVPRIRWAVYVCRRLIGSLGLGTQAVPCFWSHFAWYFLLMPVMAMRSNLETDYPLDTISSKINGTPKGVYLPNSKLNSILAVSNILAHNNRSKFATAKIECSFEMGKSIPLGVTFILLVLVLIMLYGEQ